MKQSRLLYDVLASHLLWIETDEEYGQRANLSEANLSGAYLSGANLSGANLSGANLSRANLSRADLSRANLSRANLSRANLSRADLSRANLSRANLFGADLSGADLSETNLSGANLFGADIDYSSIPLQCTSLTIKVCDKISAQLLYHAFAVSKLQPTPEQITFMEKNFHRYYECGGKKTICSANN